jgi:hypothetical protein
MGNSLGKKVKGYASILLSNLIKDQNTLAIEAAGFVCENRLD